MEMEAPMSVVHILDIPREVLIFQISIYFDFETIESVSKVCKSFMDVRKIIQNQHRKSIRERMNEGKEKHKRRMRKWEKQREKLLSDEKKVLDKAFLDCLNSHSAQNDVTQENVKELRRIFERGGCGKKAEPIYELGSQKGFIYSFNIFRFSMNIKLANLVAETIKIQMDAQVPLMSIRYIGNMEWYSVFDGFFAYEIGENILNSPDPINEETNFDGYFEIVFDLLRKFQDSGIILLSEPKYLDIFLDNLGKHSKLFDEKLENLKKGIFKFVKFLIDENECNPLESFQYYDGDDTYRPFGKLTKETIFLAPLLISPFRHGYFENDRLKNKFIKSISELLVSDLNQLLSSKESRKIIRRVIAVDDDIPKKLIDLNPSFLFELARKKERKLLQFFFRREKYGRMMKLKDSTSGDSLLHVLCSVRGKSERIIRWILSFSSSMLEKRNDQNETPIFKAIEIKHWRVIETLIELDADLDCKNNSGETPRNLLKSLGLRKDSKFFGD